jgi:hypothetical protein
MYDHDDHDGCPRCGVRDYGFDMPDTRRTLYIRNCQCKGGCVCTEETRADLGLDEDECACSEDNGGCNCDADIKLQVRINRVWDQRCEACDSADWRPEWQVLQDGKVIATVLSEEAANAVMEVMFPNAEAEAPDPAWESERWLRRAEGWGD